MCTRLQVLKRFRFATVLAMGAVITANDATAAPPKKRVPELGRINWVRGFDAAAQRAKSVNRPLLVLFQEVPGCSTCVNYGEQVLSHPLLVEAAQELFVPVAVFNNIKGEDERTLKSFKEHAWNNPVVRIMKHDRTKLVDRLAGDYSVAGLAEAMSKALKKDGRETPLYLGLLAEESAARRNGLQRATFAMHCFWEGEGALGKLDGVIATMPGFVNKEEVVEVEFDPRRIDYVTLLKKARTLKCATRAYTRDDKQQRQAHDSIGSSAIRTDEPLRVDKQPKYYLSRTPYKHVPMTALQAARVNAALGHKEDASRFLSPSQNQLLAAVQKRPDAGWPNAIGESDLPKAWAAAELVLKTARR